MQFSKKKDKFTAQITYIPISDILPAPNQPRKYFEVSKLDELSRSIKIYGVLQPIIVRRLNKKYQLIAGERRIRAASIAGLKKIPSIIMDMSDSQAESCAILENTQRENLTFLDESDSYSKLAENAGLNLPSLAYALCKSNDKVLEKLRYKRFGYTIRKAITYHQISEAQAKELLRLKDDETRLKVINKITEKGYDARGTKELVEKILMGEMPVLHSNKQYCSGDLRLFRNTLRKTVDIMKRSGMRATATEHDDDSCYEYTIRIEKHKA